MCNDLNSVTLSGKVGRIDVRDVNANGSVQKVATFSLHVNEGKDRDGSVIKVEKWNSDNMFMYLTPGKKVIVQGRLKLKRWTASVGAEDVLKSFLMVVAERIYFND